MEKSIGALDGKVAVITGDNSRIGLATAKRFVKEGAYVFITGRRQAELDKAVSSIGKNVTAVQGDASKLDDLDHLYVVVRKVKGRVDIVFANAGVVDPVPLTQSTPEQFDRDFNLNARGLLYGAEGAPVARRQSIKSCFLDRPHGRWGYRASASYSRRGDSSFGNSTGITAAIKRSHAAAQQQH